MKRFITYILLTITLYAFSIEPCSASSTEAGESAMPKFRVQDEIEFDYREYTLRKFLTKHGSPLTPYSIEFIKQADMYNLDWRMVAAISGVESTFGKHIPVDSYNAYGWAGGKYNFESWPDSISVVTKTLKTKYVDMGATSIAKIARIYAPPSTTWGSNVSFFVSKIAILPYSFDI